MIEINAYTPSPIISIPSWIIPVQLAKAVFGLASMRLALLHMVRLICRSLMATL